VVGRGPARAARAPARGRQSRRARRTPARRAARARLRGPGRLRPGPARNDPQQPGARQWTKPACRPRADRSRPRLGAAGRSRPRPAGRRPDPVPARGRASPASGRRWPTRPAGDARPPDAGGRCPLMHRAATVAAALRRGADRWLFRVGAPETAPIRLTQRRIYVLPTAAGLGFAIALVVMLVTSINYNLSLGYALVFLLGGAATASIVHAFRN